MSQGQFFIILLTHMKASKGCVSPVVEPDIKLKVAPSLSERALNHHPRQRKVSKDSRDNQRACTKCMTIFVQRPVRTHIV